MSPERAEVPSVRRQGGKGQAGPRLSFTRASMFLGVLISRAAKAGRKGN